MAKLHDYHLKNARAEAEAMDLRYCRLSAVLRSLQPPF